MPSKSEDLPGEHHDTPTEGFCLGKWWRLGVDGMESASGPLHAPKCADMASLIRRLRSGEVFLMLLCEDVAKVQVPSWQAWLVSHLISRLPAKEGRDELASPACKL